ncbi:MAG: ABC transporter ATP-binding protein [Candidatus Omnitrophica bacterium]|nr:ABC transporter ATP-binding protein [Candidatus Omnitrophota bacterium]
MLILNDVSLTVGHGRIVGIVGGSGSGKTTLGLSILGLLPSAMGVKKGAIMVEGKDVLLMDVEALRRLRGGVVSMSFQESASAFDPVFRVGDQILAAMAAHHPSAGALARQKMMDLLSLVEVPDPKRVAASYPHELSGGLRQRAMLAMALIAKPSLLIADEPTSSLDVTTQAKVMALFRKLRRELDLSILLIAHDLGMVRALADEVVVLSRGRVVGEDHPYAKELMAAENI